MDLTFNSRMEEYYKKFIELQEKLRKSEEERLTLEIKFNELLQITREEEQAHYRKLRSQYKRFLEEDRKRQERNERIVRALERIEARVDMLMSKTERFKLLRRQYQSFLTRCSQTASSDRLGEAVYDKKPPEQTTEQRLNYEHPAVQRAMQKSNEEKIERLDKYLQSISSQRVQNDMGRQDDIPQREPNDLKILEEISERLNKNFDSNKANSIAEDIMNSIYSRHYKKDKVDEEDKYKPNMRHVDYDSDDDDAEIKPNNFGRRLPNEYNNYKTNPSNHYSDKKNTSVLDHVLRDKINLSDDTQNVAFPEHEKSFIDNNETEKYSSKNYDISSQKPLVKHTYDNSSNIPRQFEDFTNTNDTMRRNFDSQTNKNIDVLNHNDIPQQVPYLNTDNIIRADDNIKQLVNHQSPSYVNSKEPDTVSSDLKNPELTKDTSITMQKKVEVPKNENDNLQNSVVLEVVWSKEPDNEIIVQTQPINQEIESQQPDAETAISDDSSQLIKPDVPEDSLVHDKTSQEIKPKHLEELSVSEENQSQIQDNSGQPLYNYDKTEQEVQSVGKSSHPVLKNLNEPKDETEQPSQQYDKNGYIPEQQSLYQDGVGRVEQYGQHYDENGQSVHQYPDQDHVVNQTDENGQLVENYGQYDENGQPNQQYEQQYDENGQPLQQYGIQYGATDDQLMTQYEQQYDEKGQPIPPYDQNQQQYEPQYDENGQLIQQFDENGQLIQNYEQQYDVNGQFVPQYDENGQIQNFQGYEQSPHYDENGQPFQQFDANGQPFQQFDENGQPLQQFDANGQLIQQYDENGQPLQQFDEHGQPLQQFDVNGQLLQQFDENGQPLQQFDVKGQPFQQFDANGQSGQQFDENGQLLQQFDENGQLLQQFEGSGQLLQQFDENGQPLLQYDETGQVIQQVNDNGQAYDQFQHDANEQPIPEAEAVQQKEIIEPFGEHVGSDQSTTENTVQGGNVMKDTSAENVNRNKVLDILDTDTESAQQNTSKISNESDFDFSNG